MLASILAFAAIATAAVAIIRERRIYRLSALAEQLSRSSHHDFDPVSRLERALDGLSTQISQRAEQRHGVSGLPTREPLLAAIKQTLEAGEGGVLGLVSIGDFERLNAFDPALAERVLVILAERIRRMLGGRRLIAQVDRALIAVWYGSEVDTDRARAQLDALAYALSGSIREEHREILPEVRIGIVIAPQEGSDANTLLARASAKLVVGAASEPGNDSDPIIVARERYALEQDLRRAIDRGEFHLHFQPLVDAMAGKVCGAEALLRWQHPTMGAVSPSRFIPIAEDAGLAEEIGAWVLNSACREARYWQRAGLGRLRVAVNISGHQLMRDGLDALVQRTLERHSLAADSLEIELTETVAACDPVRASTLFRQLHSLGVAIAIDDFGTGYSSLSALKTLSFDKIKIDREFVAAVDQRRDSQAICRSILALGQGLGIRVLAEGVERREEYEWLRAQGCSHFQGFYFATPLTRGDFETFARDHTRLAGLLTARPFPPAQPERLRA